MYLLEKTPFVKFVGEFSELSYEIKKDIFEALDDELPPNSSKEEKLEYLFYMIFDPNAEHDAWVTFWNEIR